MKVVEGSPSGRTPKLNTYSIAVYADGEWCEYNRGIAITYEVSYICSCKILKTGDGVRRNHLFRSFFKTK